MSTVIELSGLVAPCRPASSRLAGKEFDAGNVAHQMDDAVGDLVRLSGVLAPWLDHEPSHSHGNALRLAFRGEKAEFGICSCPVAHAREEMSHRKEERWRGLVEFRPVERDRFIGETPRLDELERLGEQRVRYPEKQGAVFGGNVLNGKRPDIGEAHAIIMFLGGAALALVAPSPERPRGVRIYYVICPTRQPC